MWNKIWKLLLDLLVSLFCWGTLFQALEGLRKGTSSGADLFMALVVVIVTLTVYFILRTPKEEQL